MPYEYFANLTRLSGSKEYEFRQATKSHFTPTTGKKYIAVRTSDSKG